MFTVYDTIELLIKENTFSKECIANALSLSQDTLQAKLSGVSCFTLDEAILLKNCLKTEKSIEELFSKQ